MNRHLIKVCKNWLCPTQFVKYSTNTSVVLKYHNPDVSGISLMEFIFGSGCIMASVSAFSSNLWTFNFLFKGTVGRPAIKRKGRICGGWSIPSWYQSGHAGRLLVASSHCIPNTRGGIDEQGHSIGQIWQVWQPWLLWCFSVQYLARWALGGSYHRWPPANIQEETGVHALQGEKWVLVCLVGESICQVGVLLCISKNKNPGQLISHFDPKSD